MTQFLAEQEDTIHFVLYYFFYCLSNKKRKESKQDAASIVYSGLLLSAIRNS